MRKLLLCFVAFALFTSTIMSCKKDVKQAATGEVSQETLSKIQRLGFVTQGVQKVAGGYLVEGDIILSETELNSIPKSPNMVIAQEEHYRTFNLVNPTKHPTIKIALNNSSTSHQAAFSAALDEAIRRYNAEDLTIKFQRVTSGEDITIVAFYEQSSILGSAGFPNNTGDPYNQIRVNTYHYSTSSNETNVNFIGTVLAHEIGHCIGFRHTDYMIRHFSCYGNGFNEFQVFDGVGAVHIPGTPTGPDRASWMLACIGTIENRPFNSNDKKALAYLY